MPAPRRSDVSTEIRIRAREWAAEIVDQMTEEDVAGVREPRAARGSRKARG